jgi:hypothetical protein
MLSSWRLSSLRKHSISTLERNNNTIDTKYGMWIEPRRTNVSNHCQSGDASGHVTSVSIADGVHSPTSLLASISTTPEIPGDASLNVQRKWTAYIASAQQSHKRWIQEGEDSQPKRQAPILCKRTKRRKSETVERRSNGFWYWTRTGTTMRIVTVDKAVDVLIDEYAPGWSRRSLTTEASAIIKKYAGIRIIDARKILEWFEEEMRNQIMPNPDPAPPQGCRSRGSSISSKPPNTERL